MIDPEGKQLGVLPFQDAINKAKELELDLVEVGPNANPPVAKIIDFKKFKYDKAKAEREAKRKTKEIDVKEFKVGPFIGKNDLTMRVNRMREFLEDRDRVKLIVHFPGRSITHMELGYALINSVMQELSQSAKAENAPRREGRNLVVNLVPIK